MAAYSFLDRVLHRLALQVGPIAEISFDVDQRMVDTDPKNIVDERHVFVSGLARAGTTILMRRFHATGDFRSLTYRDMPFVLAPNLWRRISGRHRAVGSAKERAHGDRIKVDFDSPEAFEEVFWLTFTSERYTQRSGLEPYEVDADTVHHFRCHAANIVRRDLSGGTRRYLSKNNNNMLRLGALKAAFPDATILVPFRNPMDHAASLLRQHVNFCGLHDMDSFALRYMNWLGHFEFGRNHRPFIFNHSEASHLEMDYSYSAYKAGKGGGVAVVKVNNLSKAQRVLGEGATNGAKKKLPRRRPAPAR